MFYKSFLLSLTFFAVFSNTANAIDSDIWGWHGTTLYAEKACTTGVGFSTSSYRNRQVQGSFDHAGQTFEYFQEHDYDGNTYKYFGCEVVQLTPEQECSNQGKFWSNGACHITHPVCYQKLNTSKIFSTNYSFIQSAPDTAPSSICLEDSSISESIYSGCHYERGNNSVTYNSVGGWSSTYVADGNPCFTYDNEVVVQDNYSDVCATLTTIVSSKTAVGSMPTTFSDADNLCDIVYERTIDTDAAGCSKYEYKGVANSGALNGPSLSSHTQCTFNGDLTEDWNPSPPSTGSSASGICPSSSPYAQAKANWDYYNSYIVSHTPVDPPICKSESAFLSIAEQNCSNMNEGWQCTYGSTGSVVYQKWRELSDPADVYTSILAMRDGSPTNSPDDPDSDPDSDTPQGGDCDPAKFVCPVHIQEQTTDLKEAVIDQTESLISNNDVNADRILTGLSEINNSIKNGTGDSAPTPCDPAVQVCSIHIQQQTDDLLSGLTEDGQTSLDSLDNFEQSFNGQYEDLEELQTESEGEFSQKQDELISESTSILKSLQDRFMLLFPERNCEGIAYGFDSQGQTVEMSCDDTQIVRNLLTFIFFGFIVIDFYHMLREKQHLA